MPQWGIGDFGSSSAARENERYASSWLKPNRRTTPWSKYFCASALGVRIGCRWAPIPEKSASAGFGAAPGVGAGGVCADVEKARADVPRIASRTRRIGASLRVERKPILLGTDGRRQPGGPRAQILRGEGRQRA